MSQVHVNLKVTWEEVGAISTGGGKYVRDAFLGARADKVTLEPGTILYKFNQFPTLTAGDPATALRAVSPWWSPYLSFRHDPGWQQKVATAHSLGVSVREWGRITSAVKENWNSLEFLLVVTLKHRTDAFFGGFSQMARVDPGVESKAISAARRPGFTGRSEGAGLGPRPAGYKSDGMRDRIAAFGGRGSLAGGGTQFYIPNLRPMNISAWRAESLAKL